MDIEDSAGAAGGKEPWRIWRRGRPRRPRGRRFRVAAGLAMMLLLLSTIGFGALLSQAPPRDEYQVKAAFLFNFAKFVEWPGEAFPDGGAPLVIGIVGSDPFGATLDQTVSNKSVNNRQLSIRRLKWGQNLRSCHILFVSSSERRRMGQIVESLKGASVLTVGEMEQFNQQGGIINFLMEENKVGFEINA
ncbi:MAG: YfiR family protein, partial [Blastocatellia bacterium]|nr:YfiR family protein [Blastocatellia bacterium]